MHLLSSLNHRARLRWLFTVIYMAALLLPAAQARPLRAAPEVPTDTPAVPVVSDTDFDGWTAGAGLIYWSKSCRDSHEFPEDGYLRRKPANGGPDKALGTFPSSGCINTNRNMTSTAEGLYYYNPTDKRIEFRPANGMATPVPIYATNQPPIEQAPLVVAGDFIYWITTGDFIVRVNKIGQQFQSMVKTSSNPNSLVVFANDFYWLDSGGLWLSTVECGLVCSKTNISPTAGSDLIGFKSAARYDLYWVESSNPAKLHTYRCTFLFNKNCSTVLTPYTTTTDHPWQLGRPATNGTDLFWIQSYGDFDPINGGDIAGKLYRMPRLGGAATEIAFNLGILPQPAPPVYADNSFVYFAHEGIKKLPVDAGALEHDLAVAGLEITQGIQNLANDVPLVAQKETYIRAYGKQLQGPESMAVAAVLHGTRNGQPLPGSPLAAANGTQPLAVGKEFDRAKLNDGWYFKLPASWLAAGAIQLRLVIDPKQSYVDSNRTNNEVTHTTIFEEQGPVCTIYYPVRTETPLPSASDPYFDEMLERYQRFWPVADVWSYPQSHIFEELEVCWWGPFPYPCGGSYELDDNSLISDSDRLLADIMLQASFSDDPDGCGSTHYIGMVHRDSKTGNLAGFANFHINASWVKSPADEAHGPEWTAMWAANTLAQETGHNHNRGHIDCNDPDYVDNNYPYPGCQLDNVGQANHYGFYGPTLDPIAPDEAPDFMSYGADPWVSDYTWTGLIDSISAAAVQSANSAPSALAASAGSVMAVGFVDATGNSGSLEHLYLVPDGMLSSGILDKWLAMVAPRQQTYLAARTALAANGAPLTPNYHLRLLDSSGTVLEDRALLIQENDNHHGNLPGTNNGLFAATFPAPAGIVTKIELLANDTVLDTLTPGSHVPTVNLLQPTTGAQIDKTLTIIWQASDVDNDPLYYTIQYSKDNGIHWVAIVTNWVGDPATATQSLTVNDPLALPGSNGQQALIRILASDGYNTAAAVSQPFSVANRKPTPTIMTPDNAAWRRADQIIPLRGDAGDVEDGGLGGDSLQWQLAGQAVGAGEEVDLTGLGAGVYSVTLTATDSSGQSATTQSTLRIAPLTVPSGAAPTLDGLCDDSTYSAAVQLPLHPYSDGSQATARLLRVNDQLWVCFSGLRHGSQPATSLVGLYVDRDQSGDAQPQSADQGFLVGEDGGFFVQRGNGTGGFTATDSAPLQAQVGATASGWSAELSIAATALGGWDHLVGLQLQHMIVDGAADRYNWPFAGSETNPASWSATALGALPWVERVTPRVSTVGDPAFTIALTGQNFGNGATVYWQDMPLATSVGSSTALSATVTTAQLTTAGEIQLTVRNTTTTELVSAPLIVTVRNETPAITTLAPAQITAESGDFLLSVNGSNFVNGAQILWAGTPLATAFINSSQLTATVAAAQLTRGRSVGVTVLNPTPVAGVSNSQMFAILPKVEDGVLRKVFLPLITR